MLQKYDYFYIEYRFLQSFALMFMLVESTKSFIFVKNNLT